MSRGVMCLGIVTLALGCGESTRSKAPLGSGDVGAPVADVGPTGGAGGAGGAGGDGGTGGQAVPRDAAVHPDAALMDAALLFDVGPVAKPDASQPTPDATLPPDGQAPDATVPDAAPPPDPADPDGDDFTVAQGDCDNNNATVYPGAPELCNGVDDNCDGEVDGRSVACYDGDPATLGLGGCHPGTQTCVEGVEGDCVGEVLPLVEACGDGLDNNCDGVVDEGCDGDADGVTVAQGDCDDGDALVFPGAPETCDGKDDDCDGVADLVTTPCYDGPAGTDGLGACHAGEALCVDGVVGACEGQMLPTATEACSDGVDDTCDGTADEGCVDDPACALIDLDSPVTLDATCVVAGADAAPLVRVQLRDTQGAALPGRTVSIDLQPALPLTFRNVVSNAGTYVRGFNPGDLPGDHRVAVTVACGAQRVTLHSHPVVTVVPAPRGNGRLQTAGCPIAGDVQAVVTDAATGAPLPGAWLMAGTDPNRRLQIVAGDALRGMPGNALPAVQAADGRPALHDFGPTLHGPQTLTVGAEGYENITLAGVDANMLLVPLRPVAPPPPDDVVVTGRVSNFENLRVDGQFDMALVLGSFNIDFLSTFNLTRLLSHQDCWDPLTQGLAAGLLGEQAVPGNVDVPRQREALALLPVVVDEHRFRLDPQLRGANGRDDLVAIAGKVPVDELINTLSGGAGLDALISLVDFKQIGVARDVPLPGDVADLPLALSAPLVPNATCHIESPPTGATVLCVAAGDWGSGRLFPMGFDGVGAAALRNAPGAVEVPLSTVADDGVFRGIHYLGAAVSFYLDAADTPPGLNGAISAILDRGALGRDGGTVHADTFFDMPSLSRDGSAVHWGAVANGASPPVDVCRVEIVRVTRSSYDPGACEGSIDEEVETPVWTAFVSGDPGEIVFPTLPEVWPRAATGGLVAVDVTPENDRLLYRLSCMALDAAAGFTYSAGDFGGLRDALTHLAFNERAY